MVLKFQRYEKIPSSSMFSSLRILQRKLQFQLQVFSDVAGSYITKEPTSQCPFH
jgi:hypothetical protein